MSKDTDSGLVVSGKKKRLHVGPRVRATLLITVGLVLVVGLAVGGALVFKKYQDDKNAKKIPASTLNGKPLTDTQKSQQAIYYGKYDEGQAILLKQVGAAKTTDEKVFVYMQLSTNGLNEQKYDDANNYAQKALAIKKTAGLYAQLAQIAALQGNKTKALAYVEQWKAVLDPQAPQYRMQISDLNEFVASLNK